METQLPTIISPPPHSISIDTLESSIQNLITNWQRRQKYQHLLCFFHIQEEDGSTKRAPWRTHLAKFLESTPIHIVALSLLLLDLTFTALDLSSSLVSCKEKKSEGNKVFHWGGIAILAVLLAKTVALVVVLGGSYFGRPGRVVDGLVVMVALLLEVLVDGDFGGLIVVVSLWRVVRVVESAFELSDEAIEAQMEEIVCQFQLLRDENQSLREATNEKDDRIAELEEALAKKG
ncbi:voltage-gated hydrogen channel-like protein [Tasmannia lanceolata]|uniref:voltage-gated hydrogen channel-like protein n=1 Tax=Tasmannia lanceolata TaxID=3420 RepID=UPI0040629274